MSTIKFVSLLGVSVLCIPTKQVKLDLLISPLVKPVTQVPPYTCVNLLFFLCVFRLRELCVKLMFLHPVDYGRKAEELLWRKVYYEVIQVIKTNKKVNGPTVVRGKKSSLHVSQPVFLLLADLTS